MDETATVDIERLKRMFSEARDLTAEARTQSLTDIDYYDSKQFSSAEIKALADRGQPDLVINRIKPAVNGIVGVVSRGRSEPRAFPRGPDDEDSADVATDVLRYIADVNRFKRITEECFRDMLVPGTCAALVGLDDDQKVTVTQIRWEEFFYDPRSRRHDFADARYMGVAKWMYADDIAAMYPDKREEIESTVASSPTMTPDETFQDRPGAIPVQWVDRRGRRLMVIELYYRERAWKRCVFVSGATLEEGDSPYTDEHGRPANPIVAHSAYVDRDNNRYGAVRDMRGPQDEINKRRSKALHLMSVSQVQAVDPQSIGEDADKVRAEAARPDGVIPFGWQKVPTNAALTGQIELLQEAKAEIERMGPNPAILGRDGADASGRALLARQQSGLVELAHLYSGLDDWTLRVYRQCWATAKQFWKAPMFVRVTDDEDAPKFVGINEPQMGPPTVGMGPNGLPALVPNVLGYKNAIGEMDVDIILDTTPDTTNVQAEQFQDLLQLVGASPIYQQQVPFEVLLDLSPIPHKRQLIDKIKGFREQQQQAQAQAMARQQQMAEQAAASEIAKTNSETAKNHATAGAAVVNALSTAHNAHADFAVRGFEAGLTSGQPAAGAPGDQAA